MASSYFTFLAGTPKYVPFSVMDFTTTAPAPIIQPAQTLKPWIITAPAPIQESSSRCTVPQILAEMEREQEAGLAVILRNYSLNADEEYAMPYYKRISDLFQYPNVCSMVKWLKDESRREKCVSLITALAEKEL